MEATEERTQEAMDRLTVASPGEIYMTTPKSHMQQEQFDVNSKPGEKKETDEASTVQSFDRGDLGGQKSGIEPSAHDTTKAPTLAFSSRRNMGRSAGEYV